MEIEGLDFVGFYELGPGFYEHFPHTQSEAQIR
jgi:hypothetical protein